MTYPHKEYHSLAKIHRQMQEEREYHQSAIDEQLTTASDVKLDEFMQSLKQLDELYDWGLMTTTPEQKKEIINKVLHEFVLYPDKIELRWKLPVTSEHVAQTLQAC